MIHPLAPGTPDKRHLPVEDHVPDEDQFADEDRAPIV